MVLGITQKSCFGVPFDISKSQLSNEGSMVLDSSFGTVTDFLAILPDGGRSVGTFPAKAPHFLQTAVMSCITLSVQYVIKF